MAHEKLAGNLYKRGKIVLEVQDRRMIVSKLFFTLLWSNGVRLHYVVAGRGEPVLLEDRSTSHLQSRPGPN